MKSLADIAWADWRPDQQATLLFVLCAGQILLIYKKRGLGAGKINGPGGRLEPGETLLQCACREVREELCIEADGVMQAGRLRFQFIDGFSIEGFVFTASDYTGTPTETDEAVPIWYPVDNLPYERMWADDRIWMPIMLAGCPFDGRFLFDGEVMLDYRIQNVNLNDFRT